MRTRTIVAMLGITCLALARPLDAQSIRGRLVDGASKAPIVGALAELRDQQGKMVGQTFTSPSGYFTFAGAPNQTYQLRVAAIGFAKHAPVAVVMGAEPVVVPDLVLTGMVVSLPALTAMGGKRACGKSELSPETFGGLLESARTSLQVMDATLTSANLAFEMQLVHSLTVKKSSTDSSVSADTVAGTLHQWPVRSLSLDSLKLFGYRLKDPEEGSGFHYYGPDMALLTSDWFLETHCFTMDKDRSKGDTVVIKYEPMGHPKNVDVGGTLVLDRSSLTMRRLTYELRDLPDGLPDHSAGGVMQFAEKSAGLWVPIEWAIWAPITKAGRSISRPILSPSAPGQRTAVRGGTISNPPMSAPMPLVQVVGREEQRGRLIRIVPIG